MNVTFGMLMVLDLFDHGGGAPHLREQAAVELKRMEDTETESAIVVLRL